MEWQTIETAPKDRRWLLLYHPFQGLMSGKGHIFAGPYDERYDEERKIFVKGFWQVDTLMQPTHWRSLPRPPVPATLKEMEE
jgi:hypothetical protein